MLTVCTARVLYECIIGSKGGGGGGGGGTVWGAFQGRVIVPSSIRAIDSGTYVPHMEFLAQIKLM